MVHDPSPEASGSLEHPGLGAVGQQERVVVEQFGVRVRTRPALAVRSQQTRDDVTALASRGRALQRQAAGQAGIRGMGAWNSQEWGCRLWALKRSSTSFNILH